MSPRRIRIAAVAVISVASLLPVKASGQSHGPGCDSGGWGSPSCSIGDGACSVTCSEGFFACCYAPGGPCFCLAGE